jgi:hypothetical protein
MTHPQLLIALGVLAGFGLLAMWAYARRASRKATKGLREVSRMTGNIARATVTAAVIVGLQLVIVTHVTDWRVLAGVLALPALLAGATVARMFAVTEVVYRRGGGRR